MFFKEQNQLVLVFLQNKIISSQHGFLKSRSTATAIVQLTEHVIDEPEEGCWVTSLFLDLSQVFSCSVGIQELFVLTVCIWVWEWSLTCLFLQISLCTNGRKLLCNLTLCLRPMTVKNNFYCNIIVHNFKNQKISSHSTWHLF